MYSLRIENPKKRAVEFEAEESSELKAYSQRLVMLIPGEATALYVTGNGLAEGWAEIWAAICLGAVVVIRYFATERNGKAQIPAIAIATVSFVLWVYTLGGSFPGLPGVSLPLNAPELAMMVWTVLLPYVYRGD